MTQFTLNDDELEKFEKWNKKHKKVCPLYGNDGAIGGRLEYCFRPNGVGCITIIKCGCGKELNVTDVSKW